LGDDDAGKQNRAEKKSRKAMQKLGMKNISGVIRVTVKKSKVNNQLMIYTQ
jgi:nascent polypeptide-associated complex subunit alpha